MDFNTDKLRELRDFVYLSEGIEELDDAVRDLDTIIEFLDKKQSVKNLPTADQIWFILDEDLDWPFSIKLDSPLSCDMKIVSIGDDVYVDFYDNDTREKQRFLFWNEDMTSADIEKHCQEYDYWADHFEFVE